jgi:hypothetical protein
MRRPFVCLSLGLAVWTAPLELHADDADAARWLRRGVELRREHRNQEALELFRRAFAASPSPTARAQVALAEQALALWLDAEQDLRVALDATDDPWIAKNRAPLEEARAEIERHLAWLTVDVDANGAEVRLDGSTLAAGVEERVLAVSAVLEVRANGRIPDVRRIELPGGAHTHVAITLTPMAVTEAPSSAGRVEEKAPSAVRTADAHPPRAFLVGPTALAAAGIASIAAGAYFGVRALDEKRARNAQCMAGGCTADALSEDSDARTASTVSTVLIAAGIGSIAAAAAWYGWERLSPKAPAPKTASVVLGVLGMTGIGLGAYFGARAFDERNARDAQCSVVGCPMVALAHDSEARSDATASTISFSTGLTMLVDGALLWALDRSDGGGTTHRAWRGGPLVGSSSAGVSMEVEVE